jgi:hypothetical protein
MPITSPAEVLRPLLESKINDEREEINIKEQLRQQKAEGVAKQQEQDTDVLKTAISKGWLIPQEKLNKHGLGGATPPAPKLTAAQQRQQDITDAISHLSPDDRKQLESVPEVKMALDSESVTMDQLLNMWARHPLTEQYIISAKNRDALASEKADKPKAVPWGQLKFQIENDPEVAKLSATANAAKQAMKEALLPPEEKEKRATAYTKAIEDLSEARTRAHERLMNPDQPNEYEIYDLILQMGSQP